MVDNAGIMVCNEQILLNIEWGDSEYDRGDWFTVAAFLFAGWKDAP
jgi:hypothetical protein